MLQTVSDRFSRKVTIVSFILAICVMYIHAKNLVFYDFGDITGTPIYYLHQICSEILGRVGVPFFFLMSGYWMFRADAGQLRETVLLQKIKKKGYTLVIPYLIWNTIGFITFFTITHIPVLSAAVNGGIVVQMTLENVLKGIFLHNYYYSFWFMQDLIVLTAISPIILLLLRSRWLSYGATAGLMILSLLNIDLRVCQTTSLVLFMMGGILAVYHRPFWEQANRNNGETALWALLFLICSAAKWLDLPCARVIFSIAAPVFFWKAMDFLHLFSVFDREPSWFCTQSFFIYASHIFLVEALSGLFSRMNQSMAWRQSVI